MLLKLGNRNDDVKQLQTQLKKLGYNISIDGIFGNGTLTAVKDFQSKNKLSVDGIVGDKTWEKLFSIKTDTYIKKSVLDGNWRITSPFGMRIHPITKETKMHNGIDLAGVPINTSVYTPIDGVVTTSMLSVSAGNWVVIKNGNTEVEFMHLNIRDVKKGDTVKKGQKIGGVGSTGASTGVHLHIGAKVNNQYIDPKPYIYILP